MSERRGSSLLRHAAGVFAVLVVVWLAVGFDGVFFPDEGAVLAQATQVDAGSWGIRYEHHAQDPNGTFVPFPASDRVGTDEYAPFLKHPFVPWAAAPLLGAGGPWVLVVVGCAATALAALAAGLLAERVRAGSGAAAVWLAGIGSGLFVQSAIITWHSVAAAAAAGVVLAAEAALRSGRRRTAELAAAAALLGALGILVRAEMAVLVIAVALAAAAVTLKERVLGPVAVAGAAAVGAFAATRFESAWIRGIGGPDHASSLGFGGRIGGEPRNPIDGLRATILRSQSLGGAPRGALLVLGVVVLAASLALLLRGRRSLAIPLAACGLALLVLRLVASDAVVPSLLWTSPVLLLGLLGVPLRRLGASGRLVGLAGALAVAGVVASQYSDGGGYQWGGRLFAVALPLLAAASGVGWHGILDRVDAGQRRAVVGVAAAVAVLVAGMGVRAVEGSHRRTGEAVDVVVTTLAADPSIDAVLSIDLTMGRRAWEHSPTLRWFDVSASADEAVLDDLVAGLTEAGIDTVAVLAVTEANLAGLEPHLRAFSLAAESATAGPVPLLVYRAELR